MQSNETQTNDLPAYEAPELTTYNDEDILDELGPAQANEYEVKTAVF